MTSFEQLKQQIESLNTNKSPLNKIQREIYFYEQDLISNSISIEHSALLSDLAPDLADEVFGPHNYTRKHYRLNWALQDKSFCFTITNVIANKTVKLKECPAHLQEIVISHLDVFIERMANEIKSNVEFDESYASEQ